MTILVKPSAQIELTHRAYHFSNVSNAGFIVVASEDGNATIIGLHPVIQIAIKRPHKIKDVSIHPFLPLLSFVEGADNHLSVVDMDGLIVHDNQSIEAYDPPDFDGDGSGSCYFDKDGNHLWYAATRSRDEIEIQWLDCNSWVVVDRIVIEDVYGESHLSLHPTGSPNKLALWLAAGQDGQQIYWLTASAAGIICDIEPLLEDTPPPAFSALGNEFLVIEDETTVNKYQFPDVQLLGTYEWTEAKDEESLGESLCYADNERALIGSTSGCLFLVDLATMVDAEEVFIKGHEPKPMRLYYPSLADAVDVCTDITRFVRVDDIIVFVLRRDSNLGSLPWEDTLLLSPVLTPIYQME